MHQKIDLSSNYSKKKRLFKDIKFVIIHYTGMQSEIASVKRLKSLKSKVSCHYLINRKGYVTKMVDEVHAAWHAGKSKWGDYKNLNKYSIGIELVNKGHRNGYENFPNSQIKSLIYLCKKLKNKFKINKKNFLGHSDIAPLRKIDPGEKFPWKKLSRHNIGFWYKNSKHPIFKKSDCEKKFFKNLYKLGYRHFIFGKSQKTDKLVIKAFQQRYNPKNITGKIDKKTLKISYLLLNS